MQSPVGWLCFGIVVVCAISVKSGVSGNYQIIHGHGYGYPGPIFRGIVPTIGYRKVVPQVVARRVDNYEDEYEAEQHNTDHDEEDSDEEEYAEQSSGYTHPDRHRIEEEQDAEEEEEMLEEEGAYHHGGGGGGGSTSEEEDRYETEDHYYGRQAPRNNKIPTNATIHRKTPSKQRTSLKKNSGREIHTNARKVSKRFNGAKKKQTSQMSEKNSPIAIIDSQNHNAPQERNENHKNKIQLKPIVNSHAQYIATPVADLILRLSISLAKPIGSGNETATYFNVPIRLSNKTGTDEKSSALNVSMSSKVEADIQKTNPIIAKPDPFKTLAVPVKTEVSANQNIDDTEDEEDTDQISI